MLTSGLHGACGWVARIILCCCLMNAGCDLSPSTVRPEGLDGRYQRLSGAIVLIITGDGPINGIGTGFFTDENATLVTAAHVVFDVSYHFNAGKLSIELEPKPNLRVRLYDGRIYQLNIGAISNAYRTLAEADLAMFTHAIPVDTPRYLTLDRDQTDLVRVGQHVITVGFPASQVSKERTPNSVFIGPPKTLYEGIVNAEFVPAMAIGRTDTDRPIYQTYPFVQIQMPILQGVSGAPVITDTDQVMAVLKAEPEAFPQKELSEMVRDFKPDIETRLVSLPKGCQCDEAIDSSETKTIATAWALEHYYSPGTGLAVPVSLLEPSNQSSELLAVGPPDTVAPSPVPISPQR